MTKQPTMRHFEDKVVSINHVKAVRVPSLKDNVPLE